MSEFSVRIVRVGDVSNHPNADRLSINEILGFECITAKNPDGSHLYTPGDLAVYVPEDAVVPEYLLRRGGFWDDLEKRGLLSGSRGNRVKAVRLRGVVSQGILYRVSQDEHGEWWLEAQNDRIWVVEDQDVTEPLGIIKYEPVVPDHLQGEQVGCSAPHKYDFNSIQKNPHLFAPAEQVVVTEKLHGTCFQIGYIPDLDIEGGFGEDGKIYLTSKGLGAAGRLIRNSEANQFNLYVQMFKQLDANGFGSKLADLSKSLRLNDDAASGDVRVFGEIFGPGIQDLHYGQTLPTFQVFDIKIGNEFVSPDTMVGMAACLGLTPVPVLFKGPYDLTKMRELRDGKETFSGSHIREGIVIRAEVEAKHPRLGRKIGKFVSPAYLTRKGGTEYQ